MKLEYLILFYVLFVFLPLGNAQQANPLPQLLPSYVNHFNREDVSYSNKCINDIFYDQDGRLWVVPCGADVLINSIGLYQFDGREFEPIDIAVEDSLYQESINIRGVDKYNRIYGISEKGQLIETDPSLRTNKVIELGKNENDGYKVLDAKIKGNKLYVFVNTSDNRFFIYELEDSKIIRSEEIENATEIALQGGGNIFPIGDQIWIMHYKSVSLFRFDLKNKKLKKYEIQDLLTTTKQSPFEVIKKRGNNFRAVKANNGTLYFFLQNSIYQSFLAYDPISDQIINPESSYPPDWFPVNIFHDDVGNQCFLYKDRSDQYQAILTSSTGKQFNYSEVVKGYDEIIKLSSKDFLIDIFLLTRQGLHFTGIRQAENVVHALKEKWISSMTHIQDKKLLVNTVNEGWFLYDEERESIEPFLGTDCNIPDKAFGVGMKQQILKKGQFHYFLSNNYLVKYNPLLEECETYDIKYNSAQFDFINDSLIVYQSDRKKISFYNLHSRTLVDGSPNIPDDLDGFIRDIMLDSKQIIWIPTNSGLHRIDFFKQSHEVLGVEQGFSDFRFTTIYENSKGLLFLGSYLGGVQIYHPDTREIKVINESNGLSNNTVMGIIEDIQGDLWVATEYGLNVLSPDGEVLHNIYLEDGLIAEKFERFDPYRSEEGKLYFGSRQGISIIDPIQFKSYLTSSHDVQVYLTELSYYDTDQKEDVILRKGLDALDRIKITPARPYIGLKFSLSNYLEIKKNRYAYKFEGLDDEWNYLGNQSELNISRLPPGKYQLQIIGTDYRKNNSVNTVEIAVHAGEFFYKQLWFYYIVSLPFIAFGLIWARNKQLESKRLEKEVALRTQKIREDKVLIENQAQELRQLDQLKSRFFTNISHELRTPITLIKAPLENLIQKYGNAFDQSVKRGLSMVLKNAGKLAKLVEELLELSRIDANKTTLNEQPTALTLYCKQLFEAYSYGAQLKEIDYQFHSDIPISDHYLIDRKKVEKVINNLISNALKFTPEGGTIQLSMSKFNEQIKIQVEDSGRGIPEEDLPHLFDRFFQTRKEDISKEGGTGIGLSLSKELAQVMEGDLTVESEWGKGATFKLSFPARWSEKSDTVPLKLENAEALISTKSESTEFKKSMSQNVNKSKILVVEDNPDMQNLLLSLLSDEYQCILADHGAEAWEWLENQSKEVQNIKLILSDIMMPVMNGYELLENVKGHEDWKKLPIIMLTAMSAEQDKLQALRMGVDDYLKKPFSADELKARLKNLISNYQVRKNLPREELVDEKGVQFDFEPQESANQIWLRDVEHAAKEALEIGIKLNTSFLSSRVFLSERQFSRKIKALTGLTPNEYIQEVKLQKARHLLENQVYTTVNEVAQAAGYSSGSYLTRIYSESFGKKPADYF